MLVLSRKPEEKIVIGDSITVTVLQVKNGKVKLGIDAPEEVGVHRYEIWVKIPCNAPSTPKEEGSATV